MRQRSYPAYPYPRNGRSITNIPAPNQSTGIHHAPTAHPTTDPTPISYDSYDSYDTATIPNPYPPIPDPCLPR